MDTITIRDIIVDCLIGDLDWERTQHQPIRCDITLATDLRPAGSSDRLADTIDYAAVGKTVASVMQASTYYMLEALAEAIARHVLRDFPAHHVTVTLHKPAHFPQAREVGVTITRP
ncbi:MAG: dihydroneopterin aldolase [Deltaproteobacteria bacterium]|nr:dihydroneopterin aldolase [Deltaproteobacteria bacterium]